MPQTTLRAIDRYAWMTVVYRRPRISAIAARYMCTEMLERRVENTEQTKERMIDRRCQRLVKQNSMRPTCTCGVFTVGERQAEMENVRA